MEPTSMKQLFKQIYMFDAVFVSKANRKRRFEMYMFVEKLTARISKKFDIRKS